METKYVYFFGGGTADGKAELKNILGGKGANLAEMSRMGIPVPPGFTITSDVCNLYFHNNKSYLKELEHQIGENLTKIEKLMGAKFGDEGNPLLVSVRSGARVSMPGMMDTVLNLGMNDEVCEGLVKLSGNERFAWDSYRSNKYNVYYQVYDGSNWLGEEQLTSTSDVDSCPSILETVDGLIWVFWTHSEATVDATDDIYYSYTSDNGGSWSTPTQLTPVDTDNDSWPSAIQTRDSSIWVVWASNRTGNYEIFYKTSLVGDFTGPENPPGSGSYPPDGIVDDYDLAYISNAYGARRGDPEWSEFEIADVTGPENPPNSRWYPPDGVIDVYDLAAFGKNYGKHD